MTNYIIKEAQEDVMGNPKENIRIVFDTSNQYVGSGYIYVNINHDVAPSHPLNIYIDVHFTDDELLNKPLAVDLLNQLKARASEARKDYPDLVGRLYYGASNQQDKKFQFFQSNGFVHDESTDLLRMSVNDYHSSKSKLDNVMIKENPMTDEAVINRVLTLHNSILIRAINRDELNTFRKKPYAQHITAYAKGEIVGHIMFYGKQNDQGLWVGVIENLFIVKPYRNQRIARHCVDACMKVFQCNDFAFAELEVWNINTNAYQFYKKLGFKKIMETEVYAGIAQ